MGKDDIFRRSIVTREFDERNLFSKKNIVHKNKAKNSERVHVS